MGFLIVEDQLVDDRSHHLSYLASICAGARAEGVKVEIVSRVDTAPLVAASLPVIPVLHDVSGLAGEGIGAIQNLWLRKLVLAANVVRNAAVIRKLLIGRLPCDQLLCLTTALPQLITLFLVRILLLGKTIRMGTLFVEYPKLGDRLNPRMRLIRWLVRLMLPDLKALATTTYAQKSWQKTLGINVHYVVHPVDLPQGLADSGGRNSDTGDKMADEKGQTSEVGGQPESKHFTRHTPQVTSAKPIVFGFYGFARHEQGVDILMRALEILKTERDLRAEFHILWANGFRMPDGSWLDRHHYSHLMPAVRFLTQPFTPDEYLKKLKASDWVVLPYRQNSYAGRISRISIEACVLGLPIIHTEGTDAEVVVSSHGAGISVSQENPIMLAKAILQAIREHDSFRHAALERRNQAREFYSGRRFIEQVSEAFLR